MNWLAWGVLLLLQNASFTWVSRARNSGSAAYNFVASIFSNGIWFVGQFFVVSIITEVIQSRDSMLMLQAGLFYTLLCAGSSAVAQKFLMRFVEKGKRRVGA